MPDEAQEVTVVRGEPTDAELAAAVVVLAARLGAAAARASQAAPATGSRSAWSMRSRLVRESLSAGPGGWKRSALPR